MPDERSPIYTALVLPSLVPAAPPKLTDRELRVGKTALALQKSAGDSDLISVSIAVHLGFDKVDRVREIMGRVGSAGEQLGVALASTIDARRWSTTEKPETDPQHATMAVRAHADMAATWTLGAAHGLTNALLRLLWLHEGAREIINAKPPKSQSFVPFSEDQAAWLSFDTSSMKAARAGAEAASSPAAQAMAKALSDVRGDARWSRIRELRDLGFHRWRDQSVDGGTPKQSPVEITGSDYSITVYNGSTNVPAAADAALKVANDGIDLFSAAAQAFDDNLHDALNEVTGKYPFPI